MRTYSRARRFALTALCAGGTIGAAGLIAVPGQALAGTTACSSIYASGSTLQNTVQQSTFTQDAAPDGAYDSICATPYPTVGYNTDVNNDVESGTGSGAGLAEFALAAPSSTSVDAGDPTGLYPNLSSVYKTSGDAYLDAFVGSDDPPSPSAMNTASNDAGSDPEPVPVIQAPIAIIVNLPAGCTTSSQPVFTNPDLSAAFDDAISWTTLLTDAGANPSGCPTSVSPTIQVRYDSSGTSFATKQYLSLINKKLWTPYVTDAETWPNTVHTTYTDPSTGNQDQDSGSGAEAAAVYNTVGSIGYVNLANAQSVGFGNWTANSSTFWVEVQNNGATVSKKKAPTGAEPQTSSHAGNCPVKIAGKIPTGTEPNWTPVHASATKQATGIYPLCALTYDIAWKSYVSSSTLNPYYTASYPGETPDGVEATTDAYLSWELGTAKLQGQTLVPRYYSSLPTNIDTAAAKIVSTEVGQN